jgi:AcrR family transcriptional regulator
MSPSAAPATTRERLLRAAETLFAQKGIAYTPAREIVRAAGQRNESALQYHFGGLEGLIDALWAERGVQVNVEREAMTAGLLTARGDGVKPDARQLCALGLLPAVRLARRDPQFHEFLKVVGQLAFTPREQLAQASRRYELSSVTSLVHAIRGALDVPAALLDRRLDLMSRFAMIALSQRARAGESFEGADAELWVESVLDAMTAILAGPVSGETRHRLRAVSAARPKRSRRRRSRKKSARKRRAA